jgi:UDP-3-O-[3-hydroxymyristoyl] glucosamine N-acyltransferase
MIDAPSRSNALDGSQAAAAVVPSGTPSCSIPTVVVDTPHGAFERIVKFFRPVTDGIPSGIHPTAVIGESAEIADTASIGPHAVIGDHATVGHRAAIHAGVRIASGCRIGGEDIIRAGLRYRNR